MVHQNEEGEYSQASSGTLYPPLDICSNLHQWYAVSAIGSNHLQRCIPSKLPLETQAAVALKPVIPSSDLLSMLTCCLEGLLAGLCTACTAQSHMVRQQQSCCVMGILPLSRTAEKLKEKTDLIMPALCWQYLQISLQKCSCKEIPEDAKYPVLHSSG
ncbi:hypothetical protein Anapl_03310 [Anas platyrhynchos]|uniref:Uncharacterized protein n=1 Tax=Anas platyrhynchos TaxID=8839 RepID=R0JS17_ANAPL|nr:hypothetical protein Anapl_03310 [Anas platyrhynchos]